MSIIAVPLSKLQVSDLNVRINREDAESTDALEASILAHGLLEPMIGHPIADKAGYYGIFAGGRRLRALQNLAARGDLPPEYEAEIIVRDLSDEQITDLVLKVVTGRSPSLKTDAVTKAKGWVHPLLQFNRPNLLEPSAEDREAA